MLKSLLSGEECARCKICCTFDDEDIWETPIIYNELAESVKSSVGGELIDKGEYKLFSLSKKPEEELYYCTALDRQKGCRLDAESKPFDCKIWPFRVMRLEGFNGYVITLSPVCPIVKTRPLDSIMATLDKIKDEIFAEAEAHPFMVKDYIDGYPILATRSLVARY
ncbi:MAG: hypothetical protein LUH57_02150 [Ruminococcus sp.]|nr:hypothetical protein [Ruminococcus sp.]